MVYPKGLIDNFNVIMLLTVHILSFFFQKENNDANYYKNYLNINDNCGHNCIFSSKHLF